MAGKETYVHVDKFGVKNIFDDAYKAKASALMQKTAATLIEKATKLTTKTKDKKAPGFYVTGNLVDLRMGQKGGQTLLVGKVSMQIATWPRKSMFGFAEGGGKLVVADPDDVEGDVMYLLKDVIKSLTQKKVVKAIQAKAK